MERKKITKKKQINYFLINIERNWSFENFFISLPFEVDEPLFVSGLDKSSNCNLTFDGCVLTRNEWGIIDDTDNDDDDGGGGLL